MSSQIESLTTTLKYATLFVAIAYAVMITLSGIVYFSQDQACNDSTKKTNVRRSSLGLFILSIIMLALSLWFPTYFIGKITDGVAEGLSSVQNDLLRSISLNDIVSGINRY
jgi:Na+-driven multidrug efflux pump